MLIPTKVQHVAVLCQQQKINENKRLLTTVHITFNKSMFVERFVSSLLHQPTFQLVSRQIVLGKLLVVHQLSHGFYSLVKIKFIGLGLSLATSPVDNRWNCTTWTHWLYALVALITRLCHARSKYVYPLRDSCPLFWFVYYVETIYWTMRLIW